MSVIQTNAIIRELRQIDSNERNVVICNLPESSREEAEERKKEDEVKIGQVLTELNAAHIKPVNVIRVGFGGRFPKKALVILRSTADSEKILESAEKITLTNGVWITRDRTWNQREEARLIWEKNQKQDSESIAPQKGKLGARGKGPGRPKAGNGSVRGRGSRTGDDGSRKRRWSGDEDEDKDKWRRTRGRGTSRGAGRGRGGGRGGGRSPGRDVIPTVAPDLDGARTEVPEVPETASTSQKASIKPKTPAPDPSSELGAAGGSGELF